MNLIAPAALGIACLWAEARGEPHAGKVAVAEVVQRRARLRYSSRGTIASTVFWPYQFSCVNTLDPQRVRMFDLDTNDLVVQACQLAWYEAESGSNLSRGAVLYHTIERPPGRKSWPPKWARSARVLEVVRIHRHVFYVDLDARKEP